MTTEPAHLTPGDLAGLIDRTLDPAASARVEAHLDTCALCREELAEVTRLAHSLESQPVVSRSRRRLWAGIALGGALAASLALLVLRAPRPSDSALPTPPVRAPATGESLARLDVLFPPESLRVSSGPPAFIWHSVGADVYRFFLLSDDGELLWTGETPDTSLTLPRAVTLLPGDNYWWRVDATTEGIVASTGARRLRVTP
ncbi:MAG TPA: zf-HC2 domain-containing protein [Gemmatimonadales bacterium]|nr:zf-HC2 domain-containing protein [Gemmatimonadales bacterium]